MFFVVNSEDDVCGCDQGLCECNKETQTSFCVCFEGFEGNFIILLFSGTEPLHYFFVQCHNF